MIELAIGTKVEHERYGEGIVGGINLTNYEIYFANSGKTTISKTSDEWAVVSVPEDAVEAPSFDLKNVEELFNHLLDQKGMLNDVIDLGEKWEGGTMTLTPGKEGVQGKEFPIETFFHKIVMLRDRLRVLEQNINSHSKLSDEEKVHLQQYITRGYGSLTSFNVLFANKDNYFKGSSST